MADVTCGKCGRTRSDRHMERATFKSSSEVNRRDVFTQDAHRYLDNRPPANDWRCMARTTCESMAKLRKKADT